MLTIRKFVEVSTCLGAVTFAIACGSEDTTRDRREDPVGETRGSAGSGAKTNPPPNVNAGVDQNWPEETAAAGASGSGEVTLLQSVLTTADELPLCNAASKTARAAGAVAISPDGSQVVVQLAHAGLSGVPKMAHIHFGETDDKGPVVLALGPNLSSPIRAVFTAADYVQPKGTADVAEAPANFTALVSAIKAGKTYFNIHTEGCMPGEIRGQIVSELAWSDEPTEFQAQLTTEDERPVCAGAAADAVGAGALAISADGSQIAILLAHANLSGAPEMGHIHFGDKEAMGPVVLNLGNNLKSPIRKVFSAADYVPPEDKKAPRDFPGLVKAIQQGLTYFNLHTKACKPGEIRGQLE